MSTKSLTIKDLKNEFRLCNDGDDWGTAIQWWFAIAEEITFNRAMLRVPEDWQYRPSPLGPDPESYRYEKELFNMTDDGTLVSFAMLISRYAGLLDRLGKSY